MIECSRCHGHGYVPSGYDLRALRRVANLSQAELAERLGIGAPYLSRLENDLTPVTQAAYAKYEQACEEVTSV